MWQVMIVRIFVSALSLSARGEEGQCHQHCGVRIIELVCQLALNIERVVHGGHSPDAVDGMIGNDYLRDIGQEHRYLVALLHPEIDKRPRKAVDETFILSVGDLLSHVDKGHAVRIPCSDLVEPLGHGDLFRLELLGHTRCIRFMPQTFHGHNLLLIL